MTSPTADQLAALVEEIRQYSIYLWQQNGYVRSRSIAKGIQDRYEHHMGEAMSTPTPTPEGYNTLRAWDRQMEVEAEDEAAAEQERERMQDIPHRPWPWGDLQFCRRCTLRLDNPIHQGAHQA